MSRKQKALKRIERANVTPWPKLFVNLRSTRETELLEQYPIHVMTYWLSNSIQIAKDHYLQVTNEHFARATDTTAAIERTTNKGATEK